MCFPKSQEKATEKLRQGPILLLFTRPPGLAYPHPPAVGVPSPRSGCPRSSTKFGVSMSQEVP